MPEDEPTPLAEVLTARTSEEALVVSALLRHAGVPTYVGGSLLQDEFAAAQRILNLASIVIQVPRSRLLEARAVIEAARGGDEG